MFFQPKETYPDNKMLIGRWLGPAIYGGTVMTYKTLRPDDGYVCRSTVRYWTSSLEVQYLTVERHTYPPSGLKIL